MRKPKPRFRAALETLERRETPTASAGIHAAASQAIVVNGAGTGQVTSEESLQTSIVLTASLTGKDKKLGAFTGQVSGQIFLSKPESSATGTASLDAGANTVALGLTGKVEMAKGASKATGTFKFKVLSGTGLLTGATGSGTGSGTINLTTGAVTFKYSGKVHP